MRLSLRVLMFLALFTSLVVVPDVAGGATTTTVVPLACVVAGSPLSASITLRTTVPNRVQQGTPFAFQIMASDFFDIPAPYSGTIRVAETFTVSGGIANPGPFPFTFHLVGPRRHFNEGDFDPGLGTLRAPFTPTGPVGTEIVFAFQEFGYRITPDGSSGFDARCRVDGPAPVVARTVIAAPTPHSKVDCDNGGWRRGADDQARPFKNHGQCVSFVAHHR